MRVRVCCALVGLLALSACGTTGPSSLQFVEFTPANPRLGDVVTARFLLLDSRGLPLAGQNVDFKIQGNKAGVTLTPPSAVSQKGSGFAETQVVATSRVNSIVIVATAGDKSVTSANIGFAGAQPNGRQTTFQCGPLSGDASGGRHAIGAYDPSRYLIAGVKIECTAHVGDRNGDGVSGALVQFLTEAGTVGPSNTSQSNVVGNATILFKTSYPLPKDVDPDRFTWTPTLGADHTGALIAPLWMEPYAWVPDPTVVPRPAPANNPAEPFRIDPIRKTVSGMQITNNPRDNLVSMIAVTSGEEGFTDTNNNGKYDPGTDLFDVDFDDLTEPFVDANDNGTFDADERYIDTNGDGMWTGKNGQWDQNTLIWTQERLLWTGAPAKEDVTGAKPIVKAINPTGIALKCPMGSFCAQAGPPVTVQFVLSDPWYNTIAQNAESDGCTVGELDDSPVKSSPKIVNQGVKLTYPAGDIIGVTVRDARNPLTPPIDQIPPRRPDPEVFVVPVTCLMTASVVSGHVLQINIGSISGTIE